MNRNVLLYGGFVLLNHHAWLCCCLLYYKTGGVLQAVGGHLSETLRQANPWVHIQLLIRSRLPFVAHQSPSWSFILLVLKYQTPFYIENPVAVLLSHIYWSSGSNIKQLCCF